LHDAASWTKFALLPFSSRQRCDDRRVTRACEDRIMMTQQLHVSILAAPLAAIDPRALSQAWYSALRLARDGPAGANVSRACVTSSRPRSTLSHEPFAELDEKKASIGSRDARSAPRTPRPDGLQAQRRLASRPPLARRIERAFAASRTPQRATFSLGRGAARVHVILQTTGQTRVLVALCRPELQAIVSQALAQAGRALAARGIFVEMRARGILGCS
jgi:hypothetical protein